MRNIRWSIKTDSIACIFDFEFAHTGSAIDEYFTGFGDIGGCYRGKLRVRILEICTSVYETGVLSLLFALLGWRPDIRYRCGSPSRKHFHDFHRRFFARRPAAMASDSPQRFSHSSSTRQYPLCQELNHSCLLCPGSVSVDIQPSGNGSTEGA